jgi:hypothetical protein
MPVEGRREATAATAMAGQDAAWLVSKIGTLVALFEVWAWNVRIQARR